MKAPLAVLALSLLAPWAHATLVVMGSSESGWTSIHSSVLPDGKPDRAEVDLEQGPAMPAIEDEPAVEGQQATIGFWGLDFADQLRQQGADWWDGDSGLVGLGATDEEDVWSISFVQQRR